LKFFLLLYFFLKYWLILTFTIRINNFNFCFRFRFHYWFNFWFFLFYLFFNFRFNFRLFYFDWSLFMILFQSIIIPKHIQRMIELLIRPKWTFTNIKIKLRYFSAESWKKLIFATINIKSWSIVMIYIIIVQFIWRICPFDKYWCLLKILRISKINEKPILNSIFVLDILVKIIISSSIHVNITICWKMKDSTFYCSNPTSKCSITQVGISWRCFNLYPKNIMPYFLELSRFPLEPTTYCILIY
jgi:hypothetical protein